MVFRFWGAGARGAEAAEGGTFSYNPGVLALIEDAVSAKRGIFLSTRDPIYVSGLKQPADALVVSRRVQLGLEGFRARRGNAPVAVSVAIDAGMGEPSPKAEDPSPSPGATAAFASAAQEPPHDLVTLLKLSKPAQILLTHDLCQQVAGIKGLPLKSFPGRFGVYEYLWTSEERLDLLQSEPQLTLTAIPIPAAQPPAKAKTGSFPPPASGGATKAFDLPQSSAATALPTEPAAQKPAYLKPQVLGLGGAGLAALIAAIVFAIHLAHGPASAPAPPKAAASAAVSNPSPVPANPPAPIPQPAAQAPAQKPPAAPMAKKAVPKSASAGPAIQMQTKAPQLPAQSQPAPECALAMDATRLVGLGEQYRGRGDYANAIRIFREVLACDPNNAGAKAGLDKATQAQQESGH